MTFKYILLMLEIFIICFTSHWGNFKNSLLNDIYNLNTRWVFLTEKFNFVMTALAVLYLNSV